MSLLHSLFPAPRFLSLPAVGVDLSDRSLKHLELTSRGDKIRIKRYAEVEIPEGVIDRGVIQDIPALSKVFAGLAKQGIRHVSLSLPEEKAFLVPLDLPGVTLREVRASLELKIEEHVPLSLENIVFDYSVVEHNARGLKVVVTAMPKKVVSEYVEAVCGGGVVPLSLEVEAQALARAYIDRGYEGVSLIIDIGRTRSGFSIAEKNCVAFTSTIPIGGDHVVKAFMDSLSIDEVTARALKEKEGLLRKGNDVGLAAVFPVLSALREEVTKHLAYWDSRKDENGATRNKVNRIILSGGDANIPGLIEYIGTGFDASVELGNPWVNVFTLEEHVPDIPHNEALRYATAIGLSLKRLPKFS